MINDHMKESSSSNLTIFILIILASVLMEEYDEANALEVACLSSIILFIILEKETVRRKANDIPISSELNSSPTDSPLESTLSQVITSSLNDDSAKEESTCKPERSSEDYRGSLGRQRFTPRSKKTNPSEDASTNQVKATDEFAPGVRRNSSTRSSWKQFPQSAAAKQDSSQPKVHFIAT